MKFLVLIPSLFFLLLIGCDMQARKHKYIETERGLLNFSSGYCDLGMLTNNDHLNIVDENLKPITCTGYVMLTISEAAQYSAKPKRL